MTEDLSPAAHLAYEVALDGLYPTFTSGDSRVRLYRVRSWVAHGPTKRVSVRYDEGACEWLSDSHASEFLAWARGGAA
jgi:hypothetical protein